MMSMAGLAIGLELLAIPYLCAQWGGGPFLFAYLLVVILLVIPFLIVEIGMGKGHGKGLPIVMKRPGTNRPFSMIFGNFFAAEKLGAEFLCCRPWIDPALYALFCGNHKMGRHSCRSNL